MQLQLIKDDLTKMEADLAEDVTILRRKIEKAAIRYNAARYASCQLFTLQIGVL